MKLSIGVIALCICVSSLMAVPIHAQKEVIIVPIGERQLFLDDYLVAEINSLPRTRHQPAKQGAVIRPASPMAARAAPTRRVP